VRTHETHSRPIFSHAGTAFRVDWLRNLSKIARRVWVRVLEDDLVDMAAQVSFYFVLSLFPFFLVLAAIVGWLPSTDIWQSFVRWTMAYFPRLSRSVIFATILDLTRGKTGFLSFGLLTAIWSASTGFVSLMDALTVAYGGKDTRSFWKKRGIAICATIAAAIFFLLSFGLWTIGHWAASGIASPQIKDVIAFQARWNFAWWTVTVLLTVLGVDLVNYSLPAVKRPWHWITPGTLFVMSCFLLSSFGLNLYVHFSPMLPKVYGALAGFIILMIWIYLSTLILLIGAEIDRVIQEFRQGGAAA
jgi:membrane protein